jgi:hypothetical protein
VEQFDLRGAQAHMQALMVKLMGKQDH